MRFDGKVALVVGASEGIGLAIAEGLAAGGAAVVLVARREDVLASAADRLGASYVVGDAAHDAAADRAIAHAVETHGGLDLLVCNAGTLIPGGVSEQPMEQVDRMLAVNLRGPILFTRAAAPVMAGRPGAAELIVSSATGRGPVPGKGVYGATKAALHYLVPTWATELAPMGIRVNAICPGGTVTPAFHAAVEAIPGLEEMTVATNLIKRIATAEEIARPALTLLDEAVSGYVTGSIWDIDGGYRRDR
jgi:NAD(P)-dependent dehydrogenase (short-subunit alcohol dehydrogenase family)